MKKYVFIVRKAIENEVEIEAENRRIAFNKLAKMLEENEEKVFKNTEETEFVRMKLKRIIDKENGSIILDRFDFDDKEIDKLLDEIDNEKGSKFL